MAVYTLLEGAPDLRARWGATLPSSLLHWANNFAAVVVTLGALLAPWAEFVGELWSSLVVFLAFAATIIVVLDRPRLEKAAQALLARVLPPLTGAGGQQNTTTPGPAPAPAPGPEPPSEPPS